MFGMKKSVDSTTQQLESSNAEVVVEVRDIKEHLVSAYEESKRQRATIDKLNSRVESLNEIKVKYDATLVTLEEYSNRIEEEKGRNLGLTETIDHKNEVIAKLNEQINNYKIAGNVYERDRSKIEAQVRRECLAEVIQVIGKMKGNLSKQKVIDLLKSLKGWR